MNKTAIEWTDYTSNPLRARNIETGKPGHFCEKVSPGCAHCYASTWNEKRYGTGLAFLPANRDKVEFYLNLAELAEWQKPKYAGSRCFVVDMTDLFGEWISDEWLDLIFMAMAQSPHMTFQVLTKRAERMQEFVRDNWGGPWAGMEIPLPNVWLGVSVENQHFADERIPLLLETPAAVRFLSCEPLLGALNLRPWLPDNIAGAGAFDCPSPSLDWVIAGGESAGPAKRRLVERCSATAHRFCDLAAAQPSETPRRPSCGGTGWRPKPQALEWARSLRDQCVEAGVPFFWKQFGGPKPTSGGRLLDGRTWDQFPDGKGGILDA